MKDEAQIDEAYAQAVANDAETAWSPAWIANRMARTDLVLTRVKNEEGCCGGQRCMHYTNNVIHKVRGPGAARSKGVAVSLADTLMVLRNRAGK